MSDMRSYPIERSDRNKVIDQGPDIGAMISDTLGASRQSIVGATRGSLRATSSSGKRVAQPGGFYPFDLIPGCAGDVDIERYWWVDHVNCLLGEAGAKPR
jgi:hypothetical protein